MKHTLFIIFTNNGFVSQKTVLLRKRK